MVAENRGSRIVMKAEDVTNFLVERQKINRLKIKTKDLSDNFILEIDDIEYKLKEVKNWVIIFNEETIREIAKEVFSNDRFENSIYTSKKIFIDNIVEGFLGGKVINLIGEWHRGISKTYFINTIARIFRIPVFRKIALNDDKTIDAYTDLRQLEGKNFDKILVDECSVEDVERIRKMGIQPIGFACTYEKHKLI